MAASIYSIEDEFEILIGDGYVVNVQRDERIQVAVTSFVSGTEAIWERLTENRAEALRNTLIRPGNQRGTFANANRND
jgi:hypothetical protein